MAVPQPIIMKDLRPPRESIIDLALSLEEHLPPGQEWWTGDQVMDVHRLRARLRDSMSAANLALDKMVLQGTALALPSAQQRELRRTMLDVVGSCLHLLHAAGLLDPEVDDIDEDEGLTQS